MDLEERAIDEKIIFFLHVKSIFGMRRKKSDNSLSLTESVNIIIPHLPTIPTMDAGVSHREISHQVFWFA